MLSDTDVFLRDGLNRLPAPDVSTDFDARVLARLYQPPPFWERVWLSVRGDVRPLLTGAACALPVTLCALFWTLHAPVGPPTADNGGTRFVLTPRTGGVSTSPAPPLLGAGGASSGPGGPSLDALLDRPSLTTADLLRWERGQVDVPSPVLPPAPRRRACLPAAPTLAA